MSQGNLIWVFGLSGFFNFCFNFFLRFLFLELFTISVLGGGGGERSH